MKTNNKNILDSVIYGYTTQIPKLEEENKLLKQTINSLRNELDKFRMPPSLVCEVGEIVNKKAIIRLPNGNTFFVNISDSCEVLKPGDTVLVEQKNLTIIKKIPSKKKFT